MSSNRVTTRLTQPIPQSLLLLAKLDAKRETAFALPDEQIKQIKKLFAELKEEDDCRYAKSFFRKHGINIDRGGILRVKNSDTGQFELYATVKILTPIEDDSGNRVIGNKSIMLDEGAVGKVKLVQNLETGDYKVIKILKQPEYRDEFQREAEILHIFGRGHRTLLNKKSDKGIDTHKTCILQDYIPGRSLKTILRTVELSVADRFDIILQALDQIQKMHDKRFIHRDIKPSNFLYDLESKKLTVVDFGSAQTFGKKNDRRASTAGYEAPEVLMGKDYSARSDIYALGRLIQDTFGMPYQYLRDRVVCHSSYPLVDLPPTILNQLNKLVDAMLDFNKEDRTALLFVVEKVKRIKEQACILMHEVSDEKTMVKPSVFSPRKATLAATTVKAAAKPKRPATSTVAKKPPRLARFKKASAAPASKISKAPTAPKAGRK